MGAPIFFFFATLLVANAIDRSYTLDLQDGLTFLRSPANPPIATGQPGSVDPTTLEGLTRIIGIADPTLPVGNAAKIPGPLLEANEGDYLNITVINNVLDSYGAAIHWHGQFQKETPWFDGAVFTQQCPIPEFAGGKEHIMNYRFKVQPGGTYMYHGHIADQLGKGVLGPIVVHRAVEPQQAHYDVGQERIIMLSELWEYSIFQIATVFAGEFVGHINGEATKAVITVDPTKRYRFRVINLNQETAMVRFSIAGHKLTIISIDGVDITPIGPVPAVSFGPGTRFDLVLTRNADAVGSRFRILEESEDPVVQSFSPKNWRTTEATLVYSPVAPTAINWRTDPSPAYPEMRGTVGDSWQFTWTGTHSVFRLPTEVCDFTSATQLAPRTNGGTYTFAPTAPGTYILACDIPFGGGHCNRGMKIKFTITARAENNPTPSDADYVPFVALELKTVKQLPATAERLPNNNAPSHFFHLPVTLTINPETRPNVPLVFALSEDRVPFALPRVPTLLTQGNCGLRPATKLLRVDSVGSYVDVVLTNLGPAAHPMHLHGHHFWVLFYGGFLQIAGQNLINADIDTNPKDGVADFNPCSPGFAPVYSSPSNSFSPPFAGFWGCQKTVNTFHSWKPLLNFVDPPVFDTISLPPHGSVYLRFLADNPGVWPLHCHVQGHHTLGMRADFLVGANTRRWPVVPAGVSQCEKHAISCSSNNGNNGNNGNGNGNNGNGNGNNGNGRY